MVFFDPKDGRIVMKKTLKDAEVDASGAPESPLEIIKDVKWCCKENPDDTGILYAGAQGMTFLELGPTPVYATSSVSISVLFFYSMSNFAYVPDTLNCSRLYSNH